MAPHSSTLAWKNPMDGGAWRAAVHGVAKSWTWLSDFILTFHFHALEKEMATHSSVFAWRVPGMGEPGGLPSTGSHRVRHDWSDLEAAASTLSTCCQIAVKYLINFLCNTLFYFLEDTHTKRWAVESSSQSTANSEEKNLKFSKGLSKKQIKNN